MVEIQKATTLSIVCSIMKHSIKIVYPYPVLQYSVVYVLGTYTWSYSTTTQTRRTHAHKWITKIIS